MQYKIKIYLRDTLLFATDPDTIKTFGDLLNVFDTLNQKFTEAEGYTLDVCLSVFTFSRTTFRQLIDSRNQIIIVLHN